MSDRTYAALISLGIQALQNHSGVILDATFSKRRRREKMRKILQRREIEYCCIETVAASPLLRSRLKQREFLEHVVSDARLEDFGILDSAFEPPTELHTGHDISVKSDRSPEAVLAETLRALVQRNVAKTE